MHVRRFKNHGETYYPTTEGVTMTPGFFEYVFRGEVPNSVQRLCYINWYLPDDCKVISYDFTNFTFMRKSRSIIITSEHWTIITEKLGDVLGIVVDYKFKNVNFLKEYEKCCEGNVNENLPASFDVSVGTQYVTELLVETVCDIIKRNQKMCSPEYYDDTEVVNNNSILELNSMMLDVTAHDIAQTFYENLWSHPRHLTLNPVEYVTIDFLKTVELNKVVRQARSVLLPPCDECPCTFAEI